MEEEPDPNFYYSSGKFTLPNGDIYEGQYCAHRNGLIWREGRGTYYGKDGQTYEGEWRDDKLIEGTVVNIKYPNGQEYHGVMVQDAYNGPGYFTLEDRMDIICEFVANRPTGTVLLVDIHSNLWEGKALENSALLLPENIYYTGILPTAGIGELKIPRKNKEKVWIPNKRLYVNEKEEDIFHKSTKTVQDVDFSESKWCQRYLRFKKMRETIKEKYKTSESLTFEEIQWKKKYKKFLESKKQDTSHNLKSSVDTSLLQEYCNPNLNDSSIPIKVYFPNTERNDSEKALNKEPKIKES